MEYLRHWQFWLAVIVVAFITHYVANMFYKGA